MVELKLKEKKQDIRVLEDQLNQEECEKIVLENKDKAFSMIASVKRLFKKMGAVTVTHREKRYEPFWHIVAESYIEYFRSNTYSFEVEAQVRDVTIHDQTVVVDENSPIVQLKATDHCVEYQEKTILVSAIEKKERNLEKYIGFCSRVITQTEDLMGPDIVVLPAKIRASYLLRDLFRELIKPVNADEITEERVTITTMILYFRPNYAFELTNEEGEKGVLEVDALTGELKKGIVYKKALAELISEDTLFELGAEVAAEIIPGAGLVAVVGKKMHEHKKKKKLIAEMKKSKQALHKEKE